MRGQRNQKQMRQVHVVRNLVVVLIVATVTLCVFGYINSVKHLWALSQAPESLAVDITEDEIATLTDKVTRGFNLFHSMLSGDFYDSVFQRAEEVESEQDSDNDGIPDWTVLRLGTNDDGFGGELWIYDEGNTQKYTCENLQTPGKVWRGEFRIPDNIYGLGQYNLSLLITTSECSEQWQANIMVTEQENRGAAYGSVSLSDLSGSFQISFSPSKPLVIDLSHPAFFVDGRGDITFTLNGVTGEAVLESIDPENWQLWVDVNGNGTIDSGEVAIISYDYLTRSWVTPSKPLPTPIVESELSGEQ